QDEDTSVVFGMPKEAINLGGVDKVVPLHYISQEIINALRE
ncbi:MAG: chemotaxis protein CheB, partial [Gammaproteobacteria bacterium]